MISIELTRFHVALVLYAVLVVILLLSRPAIMFTRDGKLKSWGVKNDDKTSMFSFGFVLVLSAVLFYILATWLDMVSYRP
jgi:hypothetical protein